MKIPNICGGDLRLNTEDNPEIPGWSYRSRRRKTDLSECRISEATTAESIGPADAIVPTLHDPGTWPETSKQTIAWEPIAR